MEQEKVHFNSMISKIQNKEQALRTIKESGFTFALLSTIISMFGYFSGPLVLIDAAVYLVLAILLLKTKARVVSLLLVIFSAYSLIATVLNKLEIISFGGHSIIIALIVLWVAVRANIATSKLHQLEQEG